jgi:hypothetical protein
MKDVFGPFSVLTCCILLFIVFLVIDSKPTIDECSVCCNEAKVMETVCTSAKSDVCIVAQKDYIICTRKLTEKESI